MLRKEGGRKHESPLPEGVDSLPCMLTAVGRSLWQPNISPTTFWLSGISELALLTGIPNQSCLCPCIPSWLISGARCIEPSLPRIYKKVPPPQTSRFYGGTRPKPYVVMSSICLCGCKVRY